MKGPDPVTLRDAVREVIRQNREVGYSPGRFIQLTENGEAGELVICCQNPGNGPSPSTSLQGVQLQDYGASNYRMSFLFA